MVVTCAETERIVLIFNKTLAMWGRFSKQDRFQYFPTAVIWIKFIFEQTHIYSTERKRGQIWSTVEFRTYKIIRSARTENQEFLSQYPILEGRLLWFLSLFKYPGRFFERKKKLPALVSTAGTVPYSAQEQARGPQLHFTPKCPDPKHWLRVVDPDPDPH